MIINKNKLNNNLYTYSCIKSLEETKKTSLNFIVYSIYKIAQILIKFFKINIEFFEKALQDHCAAEFVKKSIQALTIDNQCALQEFKNLPGIHSKLLKKTQLQAFSALSCLQYQLALFQLSSLKQPSSPDEFKELFQKIPESVRNLIIRCYEYEKGVPFQLEKNGELESILNRIEQVLMNQKNAYELLSFDPDKNSHLVQSIQKIDTLLFEKLDPSNIFEATIDRLEKKLSPQEILARPVSVTMVSVEFSAFAKQGGLAEAVEGIALGIKKQHPENKVRLIFPKFSNLPKKVLENFEPPIEHTLISGQTYNVYKYLYEGIECYFIEHPSFNLDPQKPNIYGPDFASQSIRFSEFSKLTADFIHKSEKTDILHLHDWHSAAVLHALNANYPSESAIPTVFTYHNNGRVAQGRLETGPYSYDPVIKGFQEAGISRPGENLFISTLLKADMVTTVSERFSLESQTPFYGEGVSFAVKEMAKQGKIVGILNGSNPHLWSPETNPILKNWTSLITNQPRDLTYGPNSNDILEKKQAAKEELQAYVKQYLPHVEIDFSKPIITYIGRFDSYQKGLDRFEVAIEEILKNGAQFICMGTSEDPQATEILDRLEKKYPQGVLFLRDYKIPNGKLYYQQGDDTRPGIGPVVRSATDFVFVPSNFEPCGLVQFEGWLFGSLAIGAETGGLADSILPLEKNPESYNGFLFKGHSPRLQSMRQSIQKALSFWKALPDPEKIALWKRLISDGRQYSWSSSPSGYSPAEKYRLVYEEAKQRKNLPAKKDYFDVLESKKITQFVAPHTALSKEEKYLQAFYFENHPLETYQQMYEALSEDERRSVPAPFSKNLTHTLHEEFGVHQKGNQTQFRVHAPNATNVAVILYDPAENESGRKTLTKDNDGNWETSIPDLSENQKYRYEINGTLKIDPFAMGHIASTKSDTPFSVIRSLPTEWSDSLWMKKRVETAGNSAPMSIYEVHPLSWKKPNGNPLNYKELAHQLVTYAKEYGFTHIELMGILEHPYEGSWGYQVTGYFAPTSRMGTIEDFAYLVNYLHENQIGVILDWVPAHFAKDAYALSNFDGSKQFEPNTLSHQFSVRNLAFGYGSSHFDFSKKHVREFLISNALYWTKNLHIDALRVDCIRSIVNSENAPAAHLFLSALNDVIHTHGEGAMTIAEDFSGMKEVTAPFHKKGFQFDMKWHVGWMHGIKDFFSKKLDGRKALYDQLKETLQRDNFHKQILPISHDFVRSKEKTVAQITPELKEGWEKDAHIRSMLAFKMTTPGKKLLFMGEELGNELPWDLQVGKEKGLLDQIDKNADSQKQLKAMLSTLNHLYQTTPSFYENDSNGHDLEWIEDPNKNIHAFRRIAKDGTSFSCFHNLSSKTPEQIWVKIPKEKAQLLHPSEIFSTDNTEYGGKGWKNEEIHVEETKDSFLYSVAVPPLSSLIIKEGVLQVDKTKPQGKIASIVMKIQSVWDGVLNCISMITRYIGSKNWSLVGATYRYLKQNIQILRGKLKEIDWNLICPKGNIPQSEKVLTPEEAEKYVTPLATAAFAYSGKKEWIEPLGFESIDLPASLCQRLNILKKGDRYYDPDSKNYFSILKKDETLYFSIGGIPPGLEKAHAYKNLAQTFLGMKSDSFNRMNQIFQDLYESPLFKNQKWQLVGQSRGGAYIQYIALKNRRSAICFNSFPIGAGLQSQIPTENLNEAQEFCTHFYVKGDGFEHTPIIHQFDRMISSLGIRTPGSFGHSYTIPSAYTKYRDSHNYVMGSLLQYLGLNKRAKMDEFVVHQKINLAKSHI